MRVSTSAFWEPQNHVRLDHETAADVEPTNGIGVLLINFNTASCTLRCLDSLLSGHQVEVVSELSLFFERLKVLEIRLSR